MSTRIPAETGRRLRRSARPNELQRMTMIETGAHGINGYVDLKQLMLYNNCIISYDSLRFDGGSRTSITPY